MKKMKNKLSVLDVAKDLKKDPSWVRAGLIEGWLPFGFATRNGKKVDKVEEIDIRKGRIQYFINLPSYQCWLIKNKADFDNGLMHWDHFMPRRSGLYKIKQLYELIQKNPNMSYAEIAKKMDMEETLIRLLVEDESNKL